MVLAIKNKDYFFIFREKRFVSEKYFDIINNITIIAGQPVLVLERSHKPSIVQCSIPVSARIKSSMITFTSLKACF